jgi:threonine dehydrogenase-like Zn-dependent dehydrogenase
MVADGVADSAHGWSEVFQIMLKLPEDIPVEEAALLCTWREVYAGFSDFRLTPGMDILIFGGGPVGLSFCKFARLLGIAWIGLVDPVPSKRHTAKSLGADETFEPDSPAIKDLTARRGKPLDAVIDAVGSEKVINAGIRLLRLAGSLCVYGVLGSTTVTVTWETGPLNFNLFIHQWPTRAAEAAAQKPLIEWIRAGTLSAKDFLSAEFPVRDTARALEASQQPTAIKTLLRF